MTSTWEPIAAKKRQALADSIPQEWRIPENLMPPDSQHDVTGFPEQSGWFTSDELKITGMTASELLPQLASGKLSSEAVTHAFCKRAAAAQQLVRVFTFSLPAAQLHIHTCSVFKTKN